MEKKREEADGPWVLPVVQHGPTQYFADLRLRQFRNVKNPHDYVDFDSEQGKEMCEQAGVVVCGNVRWPLLFRQLQTGKSFGA